MFWELYKRQEYGIIFYEVAIDRGNTVSMVLHKIEIFIL